MKKLLIFILILMLGVIGSYLYFTQHVRRIKLSKQIPPIDKTRKATVLTAFFGLDEMPAQVLFLYLFGIGKNGMPLVFSQEINPSTLDNTDFEVTTANGEKYPVEFVTLKPAEEEFELRSVLFIGEYGTNPDNPPVSVEIIGDLMSRSGQNYKGQTVDVIPLSEGPAISYSEYFVFDDDYPYVEKGIGCDCPKEGTAMVVRTVWAGGVRALNGEELGDPELKSIHITMVEGSDTIVVSPYKIADLGDGDNNIDLCLTQSGIPIYVEADAGIAIDPRDDVNPETASAVTSRW